ncbi:hypothetical protein RHSIM_Rhsim12G0020000 [Rhododendron simsii]|uniref:Uncharacterized protein n=1 Tax=Rhododendron simsii TaxID=118357 RepID=A0A834G4E1_RHOSS|nr:hypothetical protein RHSIM_Rhsim12G0020000 [Rhododendron simsii]
MLLEVFLELEFAVQGFSSDPEARTIDWRGHPRPLQFRLQPLGPLFTGRWSLGLVAISKGCSLLPHSLEFFCQQMTKAALITLSKNCTNITCFRLDIRESSKPDHVTLPRWMKDLGPLYNRARVTYAGDSNRGVLFVVNGCRNLRKLEVTECPFGDAALLANVRRYKTMRCLSISGCEVTLGSCKVLAKAVPSQNVEVINGWDELEVEDYPDDRLRVTKLYIYRALDGLRSDAP